jgi:hypothetical protein
MKLWCWLASISKSSPSSALILTAKPLGNYIALMRNNVCEFDKALIS